MKSKLEHLLLDIEDTMQIEGDRLDRIIARRLAQDSGTFQLDKNERHRAPVLGSKPYGLQLDGPPGYLTLPARCSDNGPRWLIELICGAGVPSFGIEVAGDVVMGVARGGQHAPDLDLALYDADIKGVSRCHAMLRPSHHRLFLIDLQSTNGTRLNAMPVSYGIAAPLHSNDTISLGALTMSIRILATARQVEEARAAYGDDR